MTCVPASGAAGAVVPSSGTRLLNCPLPLYLRLSKAKLLSDFRPKRPTRVLLSSSPVYNECPTTREAASGGIVYLTDSLAASGTRIPPSSVCDEQAKSRGKVKSVIIGSSILNNSRLFYSVGIAVSPGSSQEAEGVVEVKSSKSEDFAVFVPGAPDLSSCFPAAAPPVVSQISDNSISTTWIIGFW